MANEPTPRKPLRLWPGVVAVVLQWLPAFVACFFSGPRRAWMVAAIVLACSALTLVRTGGITGDARSDLHWRWTPDPEQRLLAEAAEEPAARPSAARAATTPEKPLPAPARAEPPAPEKPLPSPAPIAAKTPEKPPTRAAAETRAIWPGFR